ncbi:MAG: PAS domain-containing protein [Ignavibacteriaceae bacterium]
MHALDKNLVKEFDLPEEVKKIIDTIPGFVWSARPDGSIVYLNQRGLEFTGMSLDELSNRDWRESGILHPDDVQNIFETWRTIVESGKPG